MINEYRGNKHLKKRKNNTTELRTSSFWIRLKNIGYSEIVMPQKDFIPTCFTTTKRHYKHVWHAIFIQYKPGFTHSLPGRAARAGGAGTSAFSRHGTVARGRRAVNRSRTHTIVQQLKLAQIFRVINKCIGNIFTLYPIHSNLCSGRLTFECYI